MDTGSNRLAPAIWDHQRYPLLQLKEAVSSFVDSLQLPPGAVIVDVGAGDAPYRPLFEARGYRYVACDLGDHADVEIVPGERIPLEDGFADAVVSFQVLEHVWDLDWYLAECKRLLKDGAPLFLSTHGVWLYHPHPTDYRRWTRDGLGLELETRGFTVERLEARIGPLAWLMVFYACGAYDTLRRFGRLGRLLFTPIGLIANALIPLQDRITPPQIRADNPSILVTISRPRP